MIVGGGVGGIDTIVQESNGLQVCVTTSGNQDAVVGSEIVGRFAVFPMKVTSSQLNAARPIAMVCTQMNLIKERGSVHEFKDSDVAAVAGSGSMYPCKVASVLEQNAGEVANRVHVCKVRRSVGLAHHNRAIGIKMEVFKEEISPMVLDNGGTVVGGGSALPMDGASL